MADDSRRSNSAGTIQSILNWPGPKLQRALLLAAQLHANQTRKGTTVPYLSHLMAVAALVQEAGGDEDMTVAALLHDAVEDQGFAYDQIEGTFGPRVAEIVRGCSDTDEIEDEERGRSNSMERKKAYIKHLETEERPDVLRVSLADKLHNARSILLDFRSLGDALWGRFNVGKEGQFWYYAELARIFAAKFPGDPQAEELESTVSALIRE